MSIEKNNIKRFPMSLKDALKGNIPDNVLPLVQSSFDRVGDLIIIEVPDELVKYEKKIGVTLLSMHRGIKTVAKKVGQRYGKYRRQKLKIIAGKRSKTALYKENGVQMFVNYEQAYFSSRLGNDRLNIAREVQPGEEVLVMFSGIGPYLFTIRKHSKGGALYGVELNPKGHELALKNTALNKMKGLHFFCGDVRTVVPKLKKQFDRVLMPLPKTSFDFLDVAFNATKKGGIVNYYTFWHEDLYKDEEKRLLKEIKRLGFTVKIQKIVRCGVHKPRVDRVRVDLVKL